MTHIKKNTTRTHVSAAQIDWCVIMAPRSRREMYVYVYVCVCVSVCVERYSAAETKPPNPDAPTSSGPPNAMQGYDAPSPGSVLSSCRMLLFFVCLTEWLAGLLTDWLNEWACASVFLCYIQTPSPSCLPPTQSELVVPASTPHSTNQAAACLLIMWYPSDSQRGAYGIPVQSGVLIGQQDPL